LASSTPHLLVDLTRWWSRDSSLLCYAPIMMYGNMIE